MHNYDNHANIFLFLTFFDKTIMPTESPPKKEEKKPQPIVVRWSFFSF